MDNFAGPSRLPRLDMMSNVETATKLSPPTLPRRSKPRQPRHGIRPPRRTTALCGMLLVALCCLFPFALASQGDRSPEYKQCVSDCIADVCGPIRTEYMDVEGDGTVAPVKLPLILRATFWTCQDDCSYHCTHRVTNDAHNRVKEIKEQAKKRVWAEAADLSKNGGRGLSRKEMNERVSTIVDKALGRLRPVQKEMVQYYGKWVFIRVLGAQEPLSVLFSLANMAVHVRYLPILRKRVPDVFPLKVTYLVHALISANAWGWSTIFHARDKPFTEKLDYFSAGAAILSSLFFTATRLFRIAPVDPRFNLYLKISLAALVVHILYLSLSARFNYSYNIAISVTVGVTHNVLWLVYSLLPGLFPDGSSDPYRVTRAQLRAHKPASGISTPTGGLGSPPAPITSKSALPSTSKRARRRLRLILLLLTLASLLELLDFPPLLRALDAHSLWHLSTVPIASMWYDWLIQDAQECVSLGFWIGEPSHLPAQGEKLLNGPLVLGALQRAKSWTRNNVPAKLQRGSTRVNSLELKALTDSLKSVASKAGLSRSRDEDHLRSGGLGSGSGSGLHSSSNGKEREKTSEEEDRIRGHV